MYAYVGLRDLTSEIGELAAKKWRLPFHVQTRVSVPSPSSVPTNQAKTVSRIDPHGVWKQRVSRHRFNPLQRPCSGKPKA